jgi:uncharacterized protein
MPAALIPVLSLLGSGALVGLVLGLIGAGGSILAVPALVYVAGISSTHVAIGTASIAVALSAALGLASHARRGTVKWRCAAVFSGVGILGALLGAALGKATDGDQLLLFFGILMIVVGLSMLWPKGRKPDPDVRLTTQSAVRLLPRLLLLGTGVGLLSGYFGIGGGFLIVPGLMLATGMALSNAVGTSLVAVTAFGLTTAGSYSWSGLIDWRLAAIVILGGALGVILGSRLFVWFGPRQRSLAIVFAAATIGIGLYIAATGVSVFLAQG